MNLNKTKSLTLLEVLIAIALLSVIVIGFFNIEYFARAHVLYADRRSKIHNEAVMLLEHMSKNIGMAIGNITKDDIDAGLDTNVYNINNSFGADIPDRSIVVYTDANINGQRDYPFAIGSDFRIAYRLRPASAPTGESYQVWYYPTYLITSNPVEVIATNVTGLIFTPSLEDNFINVQIKLCFDANNQNVPEPCGNIANPEIDLSTNIILPMVSVK